MCLQVCCQQYIRKHGYETSYSCLAKRAAKTNNVWNRIVRKGCKARRICMFGADPSPQDLSLPPAPPTQSFKLLWSREPLMS